MTVQELIIELNKFDSKALVIIFDSEEGNQPVTKLRLVQFLPEKEPGEFANAAVPAVLITF